MIMNNIIKHIAYARTHARTHARMYIMIIC